MAPQPSLPTRGYAAVARGRPAGAPKAGRPRTAAPAPVASTTSASGNARKGPAGVVDHHAEERPQAAGPLPAAGKGVRGHPEAGSSTGGRGGERPAQSSFTPLDRGTGMPSHAESTGRVAQLKTMGFSDESARRALVACAWDVNKALDSLLTGGDQVDTIARTASNFPAVATAPSSAAHFAEFESDVTVLAKRPGSATAAKPRANEPSSSGETAGADEAPAPLRAAPTLPEPASQPPACTRHSDKAPALPGRSATAPGAAVVSPVQAAASAPCDSKGEHSGRQAELLQPPLGTTVLCHDAPMRAHMSSGVEQLKMMGFSEAAAKQALVTHAWDVNKALDGLLAQGALSSNVSDAGTTLTVDPAAVAEVTFNNDRTDTSTTGFVEEKEDMLEDSASTLDVSSGTSPRSSSEHHHDAKHTHHEAASSSESSHDDEVLLRVQEPVSDAAGTSGPRPAQVQGSTPDAAQGAVGTASPVCQEETCAAPPAVPRKEVFRVQLSWLHESSSDILRVEEGDFVLVWPHTKTDNGWIFSEKLGEESGRGGWLPSTVLQEPPCGRQWMCATRAWTSENQMEVQEGGVFSLYANSRTELGWVYAEVADKQKLCAGAESGSPLDLQAGWVPDYCFDWPM